MTDEPKTKMSEEARKELADALRDAALNTMSTDIVAAEVKSILVDIAGNMQVSVENAHLRQRIEELETVLAETKKELRVQKMLKTKADTKIKKLQGVESSEKEPTPDDKPDDADESDSFFDEPDASSMEVVKGIILQEGDDGNGWVSIHVVKDEAALIDVEGDVVDAIIDYWMNDDDVNIEKDGKAVRIKE